MKRLIAAIAFLLGVFSAFAQDDVLITEFMASNDKTLADEDGDFPDWIEIYNAGTNTVNLLNWKLADRNNRWDFPATNLPPNKFLVVFASNKNRRIPGRPLHTNFRLDADPPEPVSLLRPDLSVASQYNPPIQVLDISYGVPINIIPVSLVSTGANARFLVPSDSSLEANWAQVGFNDASWTAVQNGVGFETDSAGPGTVTVIADSVAEFSGTQGGNNWLYGYWDKKNDNDGVYAIEEFIPFPRGIDNTLSATNYWSGTNWSWPPPSDPPWTELTSTGGTPSGAGGSPTDPTHWTIRRYIAETGGPLRISGVLAASGACGDGTVGRIFVDGVEVFQRSVFNLSVGYSIVVNANNGSAIDFAIDPGAANDDSCDTTTFTAVIRSVSNLGVVADTIADWSDTGAQGYRGWTYGAFIKTNAAVTYAVSRFGAFPSGTGPHSVNNFWNGESWQWFDGDPPFDRISQFTCQPNLYPSSSSTNSQEHWVIRRWVSEIAGTLHVDWHLGKKDLTGGGATAKIFRNGTQVAAMTVTGADFAGSNRADVISNVQVGDMIDFTVEPGADIIGDICFFNATIYGSTTLSNQFRTDVSAAMRNVNSSAYLRIPFTVSNALAFNTLTLRLKYDDGFNAYVNGQLVASRNAPDPTAWNSAATASRIDADSSQFEEFDLFRLAENVLTQGDNVLAIQGLNSSAGDGDFLIVAELKAGITTLDRSNPNYFYTPTPGSANSIGSANLGPIVTDISHTPHNPADEEDIFVTARIIPVRYPTATNGVRLYYRVQFGSEVSVPMADDGLHWDGAPGDGVYGGTIPNTASGPGQMVRYYITAADDHASITRQPPFPHQQFSAQYFGAVVKNPSLTNPLEVLHLFITDANLQQANSSGSARVPCSIYYLDEFYDNLGINLHGQSSASFPKHSYDIDFNSDHNFLWDRNERRVDDINLLTTFPDKAHMRNLLSYGTYKDAGAPYHFVVPVRVQTNGGFFGDWHLVENGDANYLRRIGRDPNGALYKMYSTFTAIGHTTATDPNPAEKKTRKQESNADLVNLFIGTNPTNTLQVRTNFMYDNYNLSEVINKTAARNLTADVDCCHKNYYFYRDSDGTGEWEAFPWDVDLSFGRNWQGADNPSTAAANDGCSCYWDTNMFPQNYVLVGGNNNFWSLPFNYAPTREMYYRRLRTLMDEQLQPPGTPAVQLRYEALVNQYAAVIGPDGALDLAKWGTFSQGSASSSPSDILNWQNIYQAAAVLTTNFLPARRLALYNRTAGNSGEIPNAQPTNVMILIGSLEYNPPSGNQAEEYIRLVNTNAIAVDISGWKLAGAIEHTFQGGTVIPHGGVLYVVPNKNAFRNRATPPRRGMGLYVEGPYKGQLSARGETLYLSNKLGVLVTTNKYIGNPTPAQNSLRVTEIMYHPAVPASGSFGPEEYEYIELRNIGASPLNLNGVHFVQGIEFTFGNITLPAGAYVLVVKNIAAFESRYGPGLNIAGQYIGSLDNGGENLEIQDVVGEKVQDFAYNNSWYPITDGAGASLVIKNDQAPWDSWGLKDSWRPSTYDNGTPGGGDTPAIAVLPVLVNEVLSHSEFPDLDKIELLNTNSVPVNIGGWFISDDFEEPKKFVIPDGTIIPAGGYLVFDETQFNPNPLLPTSFAFSSLGDEAYIFSGDGTNITGYFHGFEFGAAGTGVSFMRYIDSQTNEQFVASSTNTFGAANAYPKVGPVVISEIMYHPPEDGTDNSWQEFVEIHNLTANTLLLYDLNYPTNTWRLRGGVDFNFPENQSLAAGAYALLVSFNPTNTPLLNQFLTKYPLSPSVAIFGPYDGQLSNGGDNVRLLRPDAPEGDEVPYVLVDEVDYSDVEPWPLAADGIGASLQRKVLANFGNDPINWAGGLSPGGNYGGTPPGIIGMSGDQLTIEAHTLVLNVSVSGSQPTYYQWRFNSNNIPGGNSASLVLPNIRLDQAGRYNVVVYNSAGSVESPYINVGVQFAPHITRNPTNISVQLFSNATFTVAAESRNTPNLTYQWYFNGNPIQNATNTSYTVVGAVLPNEGLYTVSVSDPIDTIFSLPARLRILIAPFFQQMPISQFVPQGASVTVSVTVTNSATQPITYRWRRIGGGGQTNVDLFTTTDFLTLNNVQGSNRYDVIVFNEARPSGIQSTPPFFVAAIPDADLDGLPDQWEADNGVTDPNGDPDGDGMTNLAEYIAGTDPNDGQSYLKVENLTLGGGAFVQFIARSNRTYTVEYTDALTSGIWNRVRDINATSNTGPISVLDPGFNTNRFYRLATPKRR